MNVSKRVLGGVLVLAIGLTVTPPMVEAQSATSNLSQQITPGVLTTDFRDASNEVVANPTFTMSAVTASTGDVRTATGVYGDNTRRVSVDNPNAADGGWTLSLNATTPGTGKWTSGSNTYSYNGTTAAEGQLTVNPAAGAITATIDTASGVTKGASATFAGTGPITIVTAAADSADIWNGYVTGIGLSQTIPPSTPVGTYTIGMTQTVAVP